MMPLIASTGGWADVPLGLRSSFSTSQRTGTGSLRESNDLASMICVQPNGSARFHFIRFGGVAHQTSLRSPSIMMTYSNSPHSGRRVAYSVTRSLQLQDHCCYLAFPHGLPRTAAAVRGGRTLRSQSG